MVLGEYFVTFSPVWGRVTPYTEVRGFNRGIPLYTEASSFQGVGVEELYYMQREVPLYTET